MKNLRLPAATANLDVDPLRRTSLIGNPKVSAESEIGAPADQQTTNEAHEPFHPFRDGHLILE